MLYVQRESSFISTEYFCPKFLKMVDLLYCSNLRLLIVLCLFDEDAYLSLDISISLSTVSEVFCGQFLEAFVILLVILLPIKSPVAYIYRLSFHLYFYRCYWQKTKVTFILSLEL